MNIRRILLGKKMLLQIQNSTGIPYFTGEYYEACKRFAEENHVELKQNDTTLDSLLRSQASSYWSGEKLWRRAQEIKRELLNEFHSLFCQEVNKQWPVIPSGKTMEDLMQELRKKLFSRKTQELKDTKINKTVNLFQWQTFPCFPFWKRLLVNRARIILLSLAIAEPVSD